MILFGTKQRLCYSLWVIAAAILAVINALGFLSLEGQALEGYSPVIKSLQVNLARLDSALSIQKSLDFSDSEIQRLLKAYELKAQPAAEMTASSNGAASPDKTEISKQPALPDLNGILQEVDPNGNLRYAAILNGKAFRRNDQVMDFMVKKISPQGVLLSRAGKTWFVRRPDVYYSNDQGK